MSYTNKIPLIVVVGATACGKTKLAIELAKHFNGEIVSADSMQIYKDMDIGTAKPTQKELNTVPHHLVDFLDMDKSFSVAQYKNLADEVIQDIYIRKHLPIMVGGTGLYINSVIDNIQFFDEANDESIRNKLWEREQNEGIEVLYEELKKIDSEAANKIDVHNKKRVIRALEVYMITGKTMTEQVKCSKLEQSPYETLIIGLDYRDRDKLYLAINNRVDNMMKQGLLMEAKKVLSCENSKTAMGAIGYKELAPYFQGKITLDDAVENLKRSTRRYAKRQRTWFKRNKNIKWIYVDEYNDFSEIIFETLQYIG